MTLANRKKRPKLESPSQGRRKPTPAFLMKPEAAAKRLIKVKNPDGSFSSERTISVGFDDRVFNIPTMVDGKQLSPGAAIKAAKKVGLRRFPNFSTVKEAVKAADERSQRLGRAGRSRPRVR